MPIADWAAEHGLGEWAVYKTRKRAELRLAAYLRDDAIDTDPTDPLTDQVATAIALARPVAPARDMPRSSLSVSVADVESAKKVQGRVSKSDAKSGVQGCGTHPRSARSSEVTPCA
jgi:hypothetical protein